MTGRIPPCRTMVARGLQLFVVPASRPSATQPDHREGQRSVQLAAYPEYEGKCDQHRERHGDAGTHVPEHNEFPDCHGNERSLATVIGAQGKAPAPKGVAREGRKKRSASPGFRCVGRTKPSTAACATIASMQSSGPSATLPLSIGSRVDALAHPSTTQVANCLAARSTAVANHSRHRTATRLADRPMIYFVRGRGGRR